MRIFISEFVHTSDLESLNSLLLKYCNKTYVYSWLGMLIRSAFSALDFNFNVDRKIKRGNDGQPMYKIKVISNDRKRKTSFFRHLWKVDRSGQRVTTVFQKEEKNFDYQTNIFELCLDCVERGIVPTPKVTNSA